MQLSKLTLIAAAVAKVLADQEHTSEWVTYTKHFSYTTFVATKYLGTTGLTGSTYTTRTIDVTDENGSVMYTEVLTNRIDAAATGAASGNSSAADSSSDEESSSAAETGTSSSSDSSSSSAASSSSSEAGADKIAGYSLGAIVIGAAAFIL